MSIVFFNSMTNCKELFDENQKIREENLVLLTFQIRHKNLIERNEKHS